jgi:ribosome-associated heat shock protein Hsp15
MDESAGSIRVDLWLWAARFFRTRSLAKQALAAGKVTLDGQPCKPARLLRPGDRLYVTRGDDRAEIEVLALAAKRGTAIQAQALYRESEASIAARLARIERRRLFGSDDAKPPTRPGKKARRSIRGFKESLE